MKTLELDPRTTAHVNIDTTRSFSPITDAYTAQLGFGELPVNGVHEAVPVINGIIKAFEARREPTYTALEHHPHYTAHFVGNGGGWPRHGIAGTMGAEFHPLLAMTAKNHRAYFKGMDHLKLGDFDDSYTAANAINPNTGAKLPDDLFRLGKNTLVLTGVALGDADQNKTCVDSSAIDFLDQGFNVYVVADAVAALYDKPAALKRLQNLGIQVVQSAEVILALRMVGAKL